MEDSSALFQAADLLPAGIGVSVIALAPFLDGSIEAEARARVAGMRVGEAAVAFAAGKAALLVSQLWWVGLIAGAGTAWLGQAGRGKREQYDSLRTIAGDLPGVLKARPHFAT